MIGSRFGWMSCLLWASVSFLPVSPAHAQAIFDPFVDFDFTGVITGVAENENDAVPGLAVGTPFSGFLRFDSRGWNDTAGIISVRINGVELRFEGDSVFGGLSVDPDYSFRIVADQAGFGADIRNSTFLASNFGVELEDIGSLYPYSGVLPEFVASQQYETNIVSILGSMRDSGDRVFAIGEVTSLGRTIGDCFFTFLETAEAYEFINGFPDALGETALFYQCFDTNFDGDVTLDDRNFAIAEFARTSDGSHGILIGDINLDGVVDILNDAFILVANLGRDDAVGYEDGDLNVDQRIDVLGDGFLLLQNLGRSIF